MRILRYWDRDFAAQISSLSGTSTLLDATIEKQVRDIILLVQEKDDAAILELTERFDGARLTVDRLAVSQAEMVSASVQADISLRQAVAEAQSNITSFSRKSLSRDWSMRNCHGAHVGEKYDPYARVGIYIPGGTAPLVSTALMTVGLARVAGCREIVVCTPCNAHGQVNPSLLYAVMTAGATEVFRIGGAQAIAAMALGTQTIRKVQKVFGPGNAYVVMAKRLLFGSVAVDLLPGPSEVLIVADETAKARFIAADMLAQAEHGSGHERVWLASPIERLVNQVAIELKKQSKNLTRKSYLDKVLANHTYLVQTRGLEETISLANQLAPEHCEVMTRNPRHWAKQIKTAGAIFLGSYAPTVLGDYVAGPSHELPTGGAGHCFSGLTVDQFQRRTSLVEYDRISIRKAMNSIRTFAKLEGLSAHGRSASIRLK